MYPVFCSQVGATIGSILAFLLGRFVLREQAQGLFNKFKILKAVDRAIETQGVEAGAASASISRGAVQRFQLRHVRSSVNTAAVFQV